MCSRAMASNMRPHLHELLTCFQSGGLPGQNVRKSKYLIFQEYTIGNVVNGTGNNHGFCADTVPTKNGHAMRPCHGGLTWNFRAGNSTTIGHAS